MNVFFTLDIISEPKPHMPVTKDYLKNKCNTLGKELDTISREYKKNVDGVIENLKRRYNETQNRPLPCYGELKSMIKESTNDRVISKCRVPVHQHSITNMKDKKSMRFIFNLIFLIFCNHIFKG